MQHGQDAAEAARLPGRRLRLRQQGRDRDHPAAGRLAAPHHLRQPVQAGVNLYIER